VIVINCSHFSITSFAPKMGVVGVFPFFEDQFFFPILLGIKIHFHFSKLQVWVVVRELCQKPKLMLTLHLLMKGMMRNVVAHASNCSQYSIDMATCEDFLNNVGAVLSIKWYLGIAIGKKSNLSCLCNIMDQLNIVIGVNFTITYKIPNGCKLSSCCN